jgi:hypothetical protein
LTLYFTMFWRHRWCRKFFFPLIFPLNSNFACGQMRFSHYYPLSCIHYNLSFVLTTLLSLILLPSPRLLSNNQKCFEEIYHRKIVRDMKRMENWKQKKKFTCSSDFFSPLCSPPFSIVSYSWDLFDMMMMITGVDVLLPVGVCRDVKFLTSNSSGFFW